MPLPSGLGLCGKTVGKINHIAVIRLSAMGDVALVVPVLRNLVLQHPELRITMVSRSLFRPLFANIPNVDFLAVDTQNEHKGFFGLVRLFKQIRHADALADLHQVLRSKVVGQLFGISGKKVASIDKLRARKKALTRSQNKIFQPLPHVTQNYARVFESLGLSFSVDPSHGISPRLIPSADFPFAKLSRWIGIAPFAAHQSKVYPKDLMQQVIDSLQGHGHIFLLGGRSEVVQLEEFAKGLAGITIVPGKLSFEQELMLISNLDVMLAMDSGNAHLAAIYGVPTVTLWGATHPYAGFAPFNQPEANMLTADREKYPFLPTSVYGNKDVSGYEDVMRTINPDLVVARVLNYLAKAD